MAKEFKLPDLGEGIHEAQVVNVMIKPGDVVKSDQMVLEVETDKAAVELPVPFAGTITKLNVKKGDSVKVGQILLEVGDAGESSGSASPAKAVEAPAPKAVSVPASTVARTSAAQSGGGDHRQAAPLIPTVQAGGPLAAAPAVRRYAREKGVDLHQVHGTGPGGRIVKEDVERYELAGPMGTGSGGAASPPSSASSRTSGPDAAPTRGDAPSAGAPVPTPSYEPLPDFAQWGPIRREKVAQIRKTIARQMQRAWTLPRVTHGDEADLTDLEAFRKEHGSVMTDQGVKLTVTAFLVKAVAGTLRQFPAFNSSYDDAVGEQIFKDYVHIGIAVDTPKGLMVPVLRDADRKGLMTISKEMKAIADRARDFKLDIAEMRGGTFTVTNVGSLGGTFATPMINYPEVAILGMGKLQEKPVVRNGQIVIRKMLPLFLSFDHRVIDGAEAARFCRAVIGFLENPLNLLLAS